MFARSVCAVQAGILCLVLSVFPVTAEELYSDKGFFIDLPEAWSKTGGDSLSKFEFTDPTQKAFFLIYVYKNSDFKGAEAIRTSVYGKLKAAGESERFSLSGRDAVFADASFKAGAQSFRGYFLFVDGLQAEGVQKEESDIAIICYTESPQFEAYNDILLSAVDSFAANRAERFNPGPVSQFYCPVTVSGKTGGTLTVAGKTERFRYDPESLEAAQIVIQREDRVLKVYAELFADKNQEVAIKAWKRFYRVAWRDSYSRLDEVSFRAARAAEESWNDLKPGALERMPAEYLAAKTLEWLQGFVYKRSDDGTDFINPFTAAVMGTGDCDSRALLHAIVLHHSGIDAALMVSIKHSHALTACDVPGQGARFPFDGKKWLIAETTDQVGLGLINKSMSEISDWIGVRFDAVGTK